MAVQGLVLRANGYRSDDGVVFYQKTRQRVRVPFDDETMRWAEKAIAEAWKTAADAEIPPPLIDSPKCPGCSLVGICMPDETWNLRTHGANGGSGQLKLFEPNPRVPDMPQERATRLLVAPRAELRPLYLNSPKLRVGKSGGVLRIKERDKVVQDARINEICQVNLMGAVQISTQAVQELCREEKPICYFSQGGWFYGVTTGLGTKNVFLRRAQFRLAEEEWFRLRLARKLVAGKIRNQRTMLLRNHIEPPELDMRELKRVIGRTEVAESLDELLGLEGWAARIYFGLFAGMVKRESDGGVEQGLSFDFAARNRRPPRDPVNALLSLGYSLLVKDLTVACFAVGFDPMIGFYHQPRHGRPALALDLMEPLRPLVDRRVRRMRDAPDLWGEELELEKEEKRELLAYESRMETLVTHPFFGYRVSYRRLLEMQARLLAKTLQGELGEYPVFVTR